MNESGPSEIDALVHPALLHSLPTAAYEQLARYVQLVYRWNRKINLTAVAPDEWVRLHIAECLRGAQKISDNVRTVLDFGSGAGLPGIAIQIARPKLQVTLAESQNKKAVFLREAVRELKLEATQVFGGRVEDIPSDIQFDLVALRAVDRMDQALKAAHPRIASDGGCMIFTSLAQVPAVQSMLPDIEWQSPDLIPGTEQRAILLGCRPVD